MLHRNARPAPPRRTFARADALARPTPSGAGCGAPWPLARPNVRLRIRPAPYPLIEKACSVENQVVPCAAPRQRVTRPPRPLPSAGRGSRAPTCPHPARFASLSLRKAKHAGEDGHGVAQRQILRSWVFDSAEKIMKNLSLRAKWFGGGSLVLTWLVWLLITTPKSSAETANRIVAIVNDEVITQTDVSSRVDALLEDQQATPQTKDPEQMERMVLQRLIEQRLLLQQAKKEGIIVTSDEVRKRLEDLRSRFESEDAFQQSLVDSNLTEEQLKEKLRDQLMVQRLVDSKVRSMITVSPQEVAKEIGMHPDLAKGGDRVKASHILVRVSETRPAEKARELIDDIRKQLTNGAEFAALAKRYSEDPHAEEGGAMGWVAQGELLPELDAALFGLKVGELSAAIQTKLGFHLVKVEERRDATSLSVTDANRNLAQQIYQRKFQEAFARWLTELKRHAYIELVRAEPSNGS